MKLSLSEYSKQHNEPHILEEYKGEKSPDELGFDSIHDVKWVCNYGHEVYESPHSRLRRRGAFCPICGKKRAGSLKQLYPKIAKMYSDENEIPSDKVTPTSSALVKWKCDKGHTWKRTVTGQINVETCPYCSKRKPSDEYSFFVNNPDLKKEWVEEKNGDVDTSKIMPNSNVKYWWRCNNGHIYQSTAADRNRGKGCPYCANRRATYKKSICVVHKELLEFWDYDKNTYKPEEVFPTSKRKLWFKGKSGKSLLLTIAQALNIDFKNE